MVNADFHDCHVLYSGCDNVVNPTSQLLNIGKERKIFESQEEEFQKRRYRRVQERREEGQKE